MADNVKPTRMGLIETKHKLALASKGHKILAQKRDALVLKFFEIVKKASDLRTELDRQTVLAYSALALAECIHSDSGLAVIALTTEEPPEINVSVRNIMGVRIPAIEGRYVKKPLEARGYDYADTSARLDYAIDLFSDVLAKAILVAETETALKRLLNEIEKTNRRVNALEFRVQPELRETSRTIKLHLNRLESEQFYALKVTKRRLNRKAEAEEAARSAGAAVAQAPKRPKAKIVAA